MGDPHWSNVVFLAGFNGTDGATTYTEESANARSVTFSGNGQLDTAQARFGIASFLVDGTGDYAQYADNDDWHILPTATSPFTVEVSIRWSSLASRNEYVLCQWNSSTNQRGWTFFKSTDGNLYFELSNDGTNNIIELILIDDVLANATANTWYDLCVQSDGTTVTAFVNGSPVASQAAPASAGINSSAVLSIGSRSNVGNYFFGWIDNVRITKGVARYSNSGYTVADFERGADTGPTPVTGTLAATETGSDTAAFAGSVTVSGSLSATEAGSDTASLSGSVAVSGSLAATEAGADTAALSGSVSPAGVSGTMVATESGSDTASFTGAVEGGAVETPRPEVSWPVTYPRRKSRKEQDSERAEGLRKAYTALRKQRKRLSRTTRNALLNIVGRDHPGAKVLPPADEIDWLWLALTEGLPEQADEVFALAAEEARNWVAPPKPSQPIAPILPIVELPPALDDEDDEITLLLLAA